MVMLGTQHAPPVLPRLRSLPHTSLCKAPVRQTALERAPCSQHALSRPQGARSPLHRGRGAPLAPPPSGCVKEVCLQFRRS